MLQAIDLTKRYAEVQALAGFSLEVAAGEIAGLVGHNGAGKTTFVEMVSGLLRPDGGVVLVDGRPPGQSRDRIGVSPQHIALYRSITVREHLRLYGKLAGLRGAALRREIDDLSGALRLTGFLDRPAGLLSGGQQRRAQAATALIHRPTLLLLDEPTAGADPDTRQALLDVVRQRADDGAAVVYTTHYLNELTELRATIAVAAKGRVIARGSSAQLLDGLPGEVRVSAADGPVQVSTNDLTSTLLEVLRTVRRPVDSVELHPPTLDDLYRSLAAADVH
ncbi:ABC transporter ATP-binding protein [Streptomyces sp. SL13]|uniref:ABC transporter ATP-binding protein n=1 Tax=Streptantibioticus silvisoli TaxID=2705255 RepID=A0AA90KCG3_9ACTN|nr:ABC transporter ATP-binding protein [Streptantibioticus silvisoli]MDI5964560.1 ABC transporter ATP-binding protein [Streptantibioticus silvisoli]MDI5974472.1 ABC transporter ATP-binding protein [Streptantibioticus silvisoli]